MFLTVWRQKTLGSNWNLGGLKDTLAPHFEIWGGYSPPRPPLPTPMAVYVMLRHWYIITNLTLTSPDLSLTRNSVRLQFTGKKIEHPSLSDTQLFYQAIQTYVRAHNSPLALPVKLPRFTVLSACSWNLQLWANPPSEYYRLYMPAFYRILFVSHKAYPIKYYHTLCDLSHWPTVYVLLCSNVVFMFSTFNDALLCIMWLAG